MSYVFSTITDLLIIRKVLSATVARKIMNTIGEQRSFCRSIFIPTSVPGLFGPAAALMTLAFISGYDDIQTVTIVLLFIAVGINSACYCGFNVNHVDLSPTYAGTLMGITNGGSNVLSIIAPISIKYIVADKVRRIKYQKYKAHTTRHYKTRQNTVRYEKTR